VESLRCHGTGLTKERNKTEGRASQFLKSLIYIIHLLLGIFL
jgi:hypothetical protein